MKRAYQVLAVALFFSLMFSALPSYSRQSVVLKKLSASLQDVLFKIRHSSATLPARAQDVIIVSVDNESCEKLNARWPWSRTVFADLVRVLKEQGAEVIALNFSFNGLENGEVSTQLLADAIQAHGQVVIGAVLDDRQLIRPNALLTKAGVQYGYLEKIVDEDYAIRRSYLARAMSGTLSRRELSFPLRVLEMSGRRSAVADSVEELLRRYGDREGQYPIDFTMTETDFRRVPAWKVLQHKLPDATFKNKIVFVGVTSTLIAEKHVTPLGLMPGVMVHANEYVALASARRLRPEPEMLVYGLSWVVSLGLLLLTLSRRFWLGVLASLAVLFVAFLGAQFALSCDRLVTPLIWLLGPVLALITGVSAELLFLFLEKQGLEKKVLHDKMTGLYTYDYLRLRLEDEWQRCVRLQMPVSVVMTDLDRFKRINDTLGHETGNRMILHAAAVIRESARGYDVVSRYGGDEFAILLWHANAEEANAYRDRLRILYEKRSQELSEPLLKESTISIGVASFDPKELQNAPRNPQELVETADKDLFRDKESRRRPGEASR